MLRRKQRDIYSCHQSISRPQRPAQFTTISDVISLVGFTPTVAFIFNCGNFNSFKDSCSAYLHLWPGLSYIDRISLSVFGRKTAPSRSSIFNNGCISASFGVITSTSSPKHLAMEVRVLVLQNVLYPVQH